MLPRLLEVGKFPPRMQRGDAAVPGGRLARRRGRSRQAAAHHVLAGGRRRRTSRFPMVITRDPKRGIRNVGMYRVMQTGKTTLAMHWQRHKVGAAHWREMAERGEKMPVCIALGADPPSMYSASAPLPPTIDEFLFAGFLRQRAGVAREGGDVRSRGARRSGLRDRGLHRSGGGARDRGAVRRSHRLLLARRSLSAGARHGDHDARRSRSSRRRSSAVRRWRISTSATRPSGSSCRCSS